MSEPLPVALLDEIDKVCLRFEAAQKAGQRPDIETLLQQVPEAARAELLLDLVALDLEYRRRCGETPALDSYKCRFPRFSSMIEGVFQNSLLTLHLPNHAGSNSKSFDFALRLTNTDDPGRVSTSKRPAERANDEAGAHWAGKFEVVRPLKRGGQASALLAFDPDLKRHVVLKLYRNANTAETQETILGEGQALARVRSPFVAQCFGVERHHGMPYLVVEYIPGQDLAERQRTRPLDVKDALEMIAQLAEGLAAVHACGLLHRDVKPGNIIIGDDGAPRLVDFGLAAALASDTLRGISGTAPYMAPEQARGLVERIDQRTDIFGLGAILYQLLTGRPPYQGASDDDLLAAARTGDVPGAKDIQHMLPESVNQLCMRCLAKDPAHRFQSAEALRDAIRSWQQSGTANFGPKIFKATRAGMAGILCGTLMAALALSLFILATDRNPFGRVAANALEGDLEVRISSTDGDGPKRWTKVNEPGVVPVRNGALAHIEVRLNQPAFMYLLWIESVGDVKPLYPWDPAKGFEADTVRAGARDRLHSPEQLDRGWEVRSPTGLETAVLLVRRSPLPPDVNLPAAIGKLSPTRLTNPHEVARFDLTPGQDIAPQKKVAHHDLVTDEAKRIDDPLLNLIERLKPHFELIKTVRFAHLGD